MCGIAGLFTQSSDPSGNTAGSQHQLSAALDRLRHRGPDDVGVWRGPGCLLGHRRLSILDLSAAGHQPMTSSDGRLVVVLNGEIYNFIELRSELQRFGHSFRTGTDTEVLL